MSCTVLKHYVTPTTPNNRYYYPGFTKEETRLKKSRHIASKDFKLRYCLTHRAKNAIPTFLLGPPHFNLLDN